MAWEKSIAQKVAVTFYKSGVPTAPSGALTATINKDGGGFGAIGGTCVQTGTTPTALLTLNTADTNCDTGVVRIVDGGGAVDDRYVEFVTEAGYTATRAAYLDASVAAANNGTPPTAQAIATYVWATNATGAAVAATLAGITSLAAWLRLLGRKSAGDSTAKTELNTGGGTYDETTDSLQALRDRGDAAWTPAGTGSRVVTVTVSDGDGDPVPDASVTLTNTAGTATLAGPLTTNSSGQCVFNRDDAETGKAVVRSSALIGAGSTAYTVSGATAVAVTVALASIPAPSSPDNYVLYGSVLDWVGDVALAANAVTVSIAAIDRAAQTDAAANAFRLDVGTHVHNAADGSFSLEVAKTTVDSRVTLRFAWTATIDGAAVAKTARWRAKIAAPTSGALIAFADLSPELCP